VIPRVIPLCREFSHAGEYHQAYRHPEGKRYCPVVVGPNGRIKPDWVMVNDRQEKHPEGAYYLDWNEDGKRRRMSVGTEAASAYNSHARKQRELDAIAAGLIVSNPIENDSRL
jgi:integrase/recombinase XerD